MIQQLNDDVFRAYFKLKEAMNNYRRDIQDVPSSFDGKIAFYLLEDDEKCKLVYSCDHGKLEQSVENMAGTRYLKMRGNDGINLVQREGVIVSLWVVSGMCLADPKEQVDHLIKAKEKGILADCAMFVLTLKFNIGHSKETFDRYAEEELTRVSKELKVHNLRGLYHLFSDRKRERTVIGNLQYSLEM